MKDEEAATDHSEAGDDDETVAAGSGVEGGTTEAAERGTEKARANADADEDADAETREAAGDRESGTAAGEAGADGAASAVDALPEDVAAALTEELDDHVELLLCLDFDGTLAEIVDRPDDAALREGNRDLLCALRDDPRVAVAIISGRELRDVRERVDVDDVIYAGNHGMELARGDDDPDVHPMVERYADAIGGVCESLADRFAEIDGVEVENKGETATIHYRHLSDDRTDEVEEAVAAVVEEAEDELHVTDGKEIVELRPPVDWDKGRVVELLDDSRGEACLTVYVGDDVTDEDAFRAIQPDGVGVLVGDRSETDARLRVAAPEAVSALLSWLVEDGLDRLRDRDEDEDDPDRPSPMSEVPDWA